MWRTLQRLQGSSGSVLILAALSIFFLGAIAIIAVDVSKLLVTRAQLQNAADAGALAGAQRFMEKPVPDQGAIETRAEDVAKLNKAFTEERQGSQQVDQVQQAIAEAVTDPADDFYGTVYCTTRAVVSQYFTGIVGQSAAGNVAALAAARAGEVCDIECLKPWSIPDRWDDQTKIAGWPGWQNNKRWDHEKFVDLNGDGIWEPGELYLDGVDANGKGVSLPNGKYDAEYYDPIYTGYTAEKDLGLELNVKSGTPSGTSASGQYYPIDLPSDETAETGASRYRWNIANCNHSPVSVGDYLWTETGAMTGPTAQGVRDLVADDPSAYWDTSCECVKSQYGGKSPRIVYLPLHDPRIPLSPGKQTIRIAKIAAFFIEAIRGDGTVTGRFMKVQAPGQQCAPGQTSGGFVYNLSLVDPKGPAVAAAK